MIEWHRAPTYRQAFYADLNGRRLFVQQTRRTMSHPIIRPEFEGFVGGVRVGDFATVDEAKAKCTARYQ